MTVTAAAATELRLTVNVIVLLATASVTLAALLIEMLGNSESSLTMVTRPWPSAMVALTGNDRSMTNRSNSSSSESVAIVTLTFWVVTPAAKVSVPEAVV